MSKRDWDRFQSAFLSLQTRPSPMGQNRTEWDWWTQLHVDNMAFAHGSAMFFPFHRAYVAALEQRLQKIEPSIAFPFWDWSHDWEDPLASPIFSPAYGLDVRLESQGDCRYPRAVFRPHCLLRDYNPSNFTRYYSPQSVAAVIAGEEDYDAFRELIELVPHAIVHTSLGGQKGDMALMNSPNDPIFWLHHSMVDQVWTYWQRFDAKRARAYVGGEAGLQRVIRPFNVTVADVMDIEKLCYEYQGFSQNTLLESSLRESGPIPGRLIQLSRSQASRRPRKNISVAPRKARAMKAKTFFPFQTYGFPNYMQNYLRVFDTSCFGWPSSFFNTSPWFRLNGFAPERILLAEKKWKTIVQNAYEKQCPE